MIEPNGAGSEADLAFTSLATEYLDDWARRFPDAATALGDHRYDAHLPDPSLAALDDDRRATEGWMARLGAIDTGALGPENRIDAGMLDNALRRRLFEIDELRERTWNPMVTNPGRAIRMLLARDFAPLPERLASVAGRLAEMPAFLAGARAALGPMPRVHLETAIGQFAGTISLVTDEIDAALRDAPGCAAQIGAVRPAALEALAGHRGWLSATLDEGTAGDGFADPRIGPERFARKLSLTLDAEADSDTILARAEDDLRRVSEEIARLAAELAGPAAAGPDGGLAGGLAGGPTSGPAGHNGVVVRQVLGRLGEDAPDNETILGLCRRALAEQIAFVNECRLVTVHDDPIDVIEMPEVDRGVGVAYCDSPGALEAPSMPTFIAVSPTPASWTAERTASFFREYNRHMVHDLMIHEAMPGHYLQLQHSRRFGGTGTALRAALRSGSFVEGWAVYAEQLMVDQGYPGDGDPRHVRMQQLKMQLRMIINAILDARVHAHGMTQDEAMHLMTSRGYQEDGEAAGKWRRVLLSSTQLSTYYVGYTEVAGLAAQLRAVGPQVPEQEIHDRMLAHGSPPARYLRPLLGV
jgi:uncharacterized protein (DUF885 family)